LTASSADLRPLRTRERLGFVPGISLNSLAFGGPRINNDAFYDFELSRTAALKGTTMLKKKCQDSRNQKTDRYSYTIL
jgi:hypothetical protein